MPSAILDLGTNTFNLLIARPKGKIFEILHSSRIAVKLGRGGIGNNTILPDAFERGMLALEQHAATMQLFKVQQHKAFATSALRTADNSTDFIKQALDRYNINIELISGQREAELIYKGIRLTNSFEGNYIILDIGGGSNEFIICNNTQILWKESFPLGMARLIEKFKPNDPISITEINTMHQYFGEQLQALFTACKQYNINTLVGAEGSFETIYNILFDEKPNPWLCYNIPLSSFSALYQQLATSSHQQRTEMKGLEKIRIEMIVPAVIFVKYVLDKLEINQMYASFFSLKEGAMAELVESC
jgi:exopolyphosphatase/guanosine-5'-triphosphate,3'-diphosphate pyrophosphatase